jgi:hypothetical protein
MSIAISSAGAIETTAPAIPPPSDARVTRPETVAGDGGGFGFDGSFADVCESLPAVFDDDCFELLDPPDPHCFQARAAAAITTRTIATTAMLRRTSGCYCMKRSAASADDTAPRRRVMTFGLSHDVARDVPRLAPRASVRNNRAMRAVALAILLLVGGVANATSFGPPREHDVMSPNGEWKLHVDPKSKTHVVTRDDTVVWTLQRDVKYDALVISDDGTTIAAVAWSYVRVDDLDKPAVELWTKDGLQKSWSYRELVAYPAHPGPGGPHGSFWRDWHDGWRNEGTHLVIETTGAFRYTIDFATRTYDRSFRLGGTLRLAAGVGSALIACLLFVFAIRRDRRTRVAAAAPVVGGIAHWLHLTGLPLVPAETLGPIASGAAILAALAVPVSLVAAITMTSSLARVGWVIATLVLAIIPAAMMLLL